MFFVIGDPNYRPAFYGCYWEGATPKHIPTHVKIALVGIDLDVTIVSGQNSNTNVGQQK